MFSPIAIGMYKHSSSSLGILLHQIWLTQLLHLCFPFQSAGTLKQHISLLMQLSAYQVSSPLTNHSISLTACSKSADMPIDSSHCSSGIPSSLHTSSRQLASVYEFNICNTYMLVYICMPYCHSNKTSVSQNICYLEILRS